MLNQILSAMLYKKTVIWTDLKINPGDSRSNDEVYAAAKVAEMHERLDQFMQNLGYLPTKLSYEQIDPDQPGTYTQQQQSGIGGETQFTEILQATIDCTVDMEKLIKDKFLFSQEKI